jgi:hypothetical protein
MGVPITPEVVSAASGIIIAVVLVWQLFNDDEDKHFGDYHSLHAVAEDDVHSITAIADPWTTRGTTSKSVVRPLKTNMRSPSRKST